MDSVTLKYQRKCHKYVKENRIRQEWWGAALTSCTFMCTFKVILHFFYLLKTKWEAHELVEVDSYIQKEMKQKWAKIWNLG